MIYAEKQREWDNVSKNFFVKFTSIVVVLALLFTGCSAPVSQQVDETESTEETTEITTEELTTEPVTEEETTKASEDLQQLVEKIGKRYGAVGVQVATIKDGKVSSTAEYGWAVKGVRKVEPDTKIRIASLSKTLLAMVIFRLVEEGKLELDRDISDYLGVNVRHPYFPDDAITLRMILTHTSGLNDQVYQSSLEAIQTHLAKPSSYVEKPGVRYRYNNYGFGIAATICECVTGKSLNMLAREYFLIPMGIEGSYLPGQLDADKVADLYKNTNILDLSASSQVWAKNDTDKPAAFMGYYAGGLTISAKDFAKLLTVLINDGMYNGQQYLSKESIDLMQTPQLPNDPVQCMPVKKLAGIFHQDYMYYHTGSAYGTYNLYAYNPETKIGFVVLTSGAWYSRDRYDVYSVCGNIADEIIEQDLL